MGVDMVKHFGAQILKKVVSVAARRLLGTITHFETDDNVAALTFDDGPHPEFTPRLLDVLKKHQARATFFMLGEAAAERKAAMLSAITPGTIHRLS
jgi:peptidoglycan/xylan/chitin deacetylase (PgdA/CDA1 family)